MRRCGRPMVRRCACTRCAKQSSCARYVGERMKVPLVVDYAMRYGRARHRPANRLPQAARLRPDIRGAALSCTRQGTRRHPHSTRSARHTPVALQPALRWLRHFDDPVYIGALAQKYSRSLDETRQARAAPDELPRRAYVTRSKGGPTIANARRLRACSPPHSASSGPLRGCLPIALDARSGSSLIRRKC